MKHKTLPVEPRIEERKIDALDAIFSRLMMPKTWSRANAESEGAGVKRARERLRAKQRANANIPFLGKVTRQQRRRAAILKGRQVMSVARKEAQQRGITGGSAVIRNPVDVDRVLG